MLNEEEKKAIDYLQLCYDLSTITNESLPKLGIVLNLIEKQSKEIEEYKKRIDLDNECEIALNNRIMDLENADKKWKDKIKAKIEEYKNMLKRLNKAKDIERIKAINERLIAFQEILLLEKE